MRNMSNNTLSPVELARRTYKRPKLKELKEAMETSTTFIVARHPLERFVSAYRDKILNAKNGSHHHKLGKVTRNSNEK